MTTETVVNTDADTVRKFFGAIKDRDFATVGSLLRSDAAWTHRNQDRFGGVHRGPAEIAAFMREAMELTAGTLQAVPETFMADGSGRVAALVRLKGARPDGRASDDLQVLLFTVAGGKVAAVEHFIGDPAAVAAFWE